MTNMKVIITVIFLTGLILSVHAAEQPRITLPDDAEVTVSDDTGKTWREFGSMPLSVSGSMNRWDAALNRQGWRKVQTVDLSTKDYRKLILWQNGKKQLILQVWRESPSRSGFSWGFK